MTTWDNAEPLEGWQVIPRHCGLLCFDRACPVCGDWVNQPNVVRGEN